MKHPTTGHESKARKSDDFKFPANLTITITQSLCDPQPFLSCVCPRGTASCPNLHIEPDEEGIWFAEIRELGAPYPDFTDPAALYNLTLGRSPAEAAYMAYDVLKLLTDECVDPTVPHCHCGENKAHIEDDHVWEYVGCCLCDTKYGAQDFETGSDDK